MFRGYYHSFWHDDPSDPSMRLGSDVVDQLVGFVSMLNFFALCLPSFRAFLS
jgi:hypothetical protein